LVEVVFELTNPASLVSSETPAATANASVKNVAGSKSLSILSLLPTSFRVKPHPDGGVTFTLYVPLETPANA